MKHNWRVTGYLLALFLVAQFIGLGVIYNYIDLDASTVNGEVVWKDLPTVGGVQLERPDVSPQYSVVYIGFAVILGTILILIIARLKTLLLWKLWFTLAVVLTLQIAFGAFISPKWGAFAAVLFGIIKVFKPNILVHNFTELFIYGGLATIFVPILNVKFGFILLLLLSAYDAYAVWKSKHMITMAKFQTQSGIFAGLLIPYSGSKVKRVGTQKTKTKRTKSKKSVKSKYEIRTAVLGGGDIGFPLIFAGTVLVSMGIAQAVAVIIGATIALGMLLTLSQKNRFYPAMPFLTAGCTLGFLVALLM